MIALIGTHGTGKTTLLSALAEVRPELIITDGDSRVVRGYNKAIGGKLMPREQQLLINTLSDARWERDLRVENLVCTRTPLDHYAYCKAFGWQDLAETRLELFRKSDYLKSKFFYLPIEFEIEDDGVRYTNPDLQKDVDQSLVHYAEYFKLNPITLSGSVEEHLNSLT